MAKPFGVLVCVYRALPLLKDLFLLLKKSHLAWTKMCTEQGALH